MTRLANGLKLSLPSTGAAAARLRRIAGSAEGSGRRLRALFLAAALAAPAAHADSVKVRVEGISGPAKDNVMALLAIAREQDRHDLSAERVRYLNAQARREILEALKPFGYYRARVEGKLTLAGTEWHADYHVVPGPRISVGKLDVNLDGPGSNDPALRKALHAFPLHVGDPLDQTRYEQGKRELQQSALARGYLDARLSVHRVRLDLQAYRADVAVQLQTGPRFRFGPVSFSGSTLSPALLRRYVPFRAGDPYSSAELLALQNALQNSGYFSRVDVAPQSAETRDRRVPIAVKLAPIARQKYSVGLGYGTDTGARASLGWENRRINRLGHKLQAQFRVSRIYRDFNARYLVPLAHPATDQLAFTADVRNEVVNSQVSNSRLLGVSRITTHGAVQQTLSLNYQRELYSIGLTSGISTLLVPGANWTRIEADDRIYTTRGSRLALDLRGAVKGALSGTSFTRADLQAKVIRAFGQGNRLIVRGEAGAIYAPDFSRLPPSQRFFAGGDNSVRGYAYRSLGPTDASGAVVGGKYLLVGSVELDRHIAGKWGAAVFYDAGNAFDGRPARFKRGAGVGLRWRSPVGMVRVDVAAALSEPGHPLRLHISIGPDL